MVAVQTSLRLKPQMSDAMATPMPLLAETRMLGERGGQQARLLHGAVIAVNKVNRVLVDVFEDLGADGGELGLGVTRGGVAQVARIVLAKVALRLHEGGKQRLVAGGQAHHRFVDRGIAVRVELHGLADDVGTLLALALEQAPSCTWCRAACGARA